MLSLHRTHTWRASTFATGGRRPKLSRILTQQQLTDRGFAGSAISTLSEGFLDLAIALPFPTSFPPYSSTIILTTIATRLIFTLPFSIWAKKRQWRAEEIVVPQLKALRTKVAQDVLNEMRAARVTGTKEDITAAHHKRTTAVLKSHQKRLLAEHNATPWVTILIPALSQLPLFVLSTVAISHMCQAPTPFDSESFLSLTSLSHVDPTAALPIALGVITLANVESSSWFASADQIERERNVEKWTAERRARGETVLEPRKYVKSGLRLVSIGRILWAATVPGGVVLYWVTSAAFGLVQTWIIDWWEYRRRARRVLPLQSEAAIEVKTTQTRAPAPRKR